LLSCKLADAPGLSTASKRLGFGFVADLSVGRSDGGVVEQRRVWGIKGGIL